jgi:carboxyl-terminal processing protease
VGGTPQTVLPPRTDLPPVVQQIAKLPPANFPSFDPTKPDTDYQLQEAELIVHAMAAQKHAGMP